LAGLERTSALPQGMAWAGQCAEVAWFGIAATGLSRARQE
jgi:hypothetical protein